MRCFIDSNVIISAGLFPASVPAASIRKAISMQNTAIVCDYALDEIHRVINKKFPNKVNELESFLQQLLFTVELITTPANSINAESKIRDIKDRPILRAALMAKADVLITGDKDLLESSIIDPKIITPAEFLNKNA
jgi:putative PIN family toxin of toxin-antitoxin system